MSCSLLGVIVPWYEGNAESKTGRLGPFGEILLPVGKGVGTEVPAFNGILLARKLICSDGIEL